MQSLADLQLFLAKNGCNTQKNTGPRLLLIHASHCFLQNDATSKILDKTTTTGGPQAGSESPLKETVENDPGWKAED